MPGPTPAPPATVADFKARFVRDFVYGKGTDTVQDADITAAINDAMTAYNPALFSGNEVPAAFLYAAAHFLVTNIQAVGGLSGIPTGRGILNQSEGALSSKGAGGLNISYVEPPSRVKDSPQLLQFWTTTYGQRYLGMVVPKMVGAVGAVDNPRYADAVVVPDVPYADY